MRTQALHRTAMILLAAGLFLTPALLGRCAGSDDEVIPVLKTRTATYTNVTITARNETHLCIVHAGGVGNVFYEDMDQEAYAVVHYLPPVPAGEKLKSLANEQASKVMQVMPWEGMSGEGMGSGPPKLSDLDPKVIGVVLAVGLLFHLFFSYCGMLICRKTGTEAGVMVWLPIFQGIPLLRAAGMSAWWILAMPLPLVGLVVGIVWCFKLVSARGKSVVWGILMLLPVTNLMAFLYLAFSESDHDEPTAEPARVQGLAVRTA